MKTHFQSSGSKMAAFADRVMMVNESIVSLGGASSKSVSKLSRDGGLTHGDLPQILCAFVSWLFKIRVQPAFALLPFPPSSTRQVARPGDYFTALVVPAFIRWKTAS